MARISQRGMSSYVDAWSRRHAKAEGVQRDIRNLAFPGVGDDPGAIETMAGEDPAAVAGSIPGMLQPSHMLNANQVLRKWEVPPLPSSHHEGFGSSTAANIAAGKVGAKHPHIEEHISRLAERKATDQPLEDIVASRRTHIQESLASGNPDAEWYQGKAQAMIYDKALQTGAPVPVVRKVTAAASPKQLWDLTYEHSKENIRAGRAGQTVFPNVENAARIVEASKGRTAEEAAIEVGNQGIGVAQRQPAARIAANMMAGKLHGSEKLPVKGASEKTQSFEVNLSDPTHPEYGYSPWVHAHQMSAHTPDVQDARAGGYHEENMEIPRPQAVHKDTGEPLFDDKGKPKLVGKDFHEQFLSHPAGTDIATSTAMVARTEEFTAQRAVLGEQWAKENARHFMAAPSQSMQWSVARKTGSVAIPEHIISQYESRPKGRGHAYESDEMTAEDWEQM